MEILCKNNQNTSKRQKISKATKRTWDEEEKDNEKNRFQLINAQNQALEERVNRLETELNEKNERIRQLECDLNEKITFIGMF